MGILLVQVEDAAMSTDDTAAAPVREQARKVKAGGDKAQAQAEQKIGEMAGNTDLQEAAKADIADADHRADTAGN
jgi:hypothetical protein